MTDDKAAETSLQSENKSKVWVNVDFKENPKKGDKFTLSTKSAKSIHIKSGFSLETKAFSLKSQLKNQTNQSSVPREVKSSLFPRKTLPQTSILLWSKKASKKPKTTDRDIEWLSSQSAAFSERQPLKAQWEPSQEEKETGSFLYFLTGDIKIIVGWKLKKLLDIILTKFPQSKIIRDYYRNSVDEVYDEVFHYLYSSYSDFPIIKIEDLPEKSDIFIVSPRNRLNFDPSLTGYDPDTQIIINTSLLDPGLGGTFKILPKRGKTVIEGKNKSPNKEGKQTENNKKSEKKCCNFIEFLPLVKRSKSTQHFNGKTDMPLTLPLFANIEETKLISWRALVQDMKLSLPKSSRKSIIIQNNFETKPSTYGSGREKSLNGFKVKEGTGGFRKTSLPTLKLENDRRNYRIQTLQMPSEYHNEESPAKLPKMKDVVKEIQSVDKILKNSLTRNETIAIATEYCSLQLKSESAEGLAPNIVCMKYSLPFGVLKGINEKLLEGDKMTWKEFSLFYIILVLERAELYNIVVFLFKYLGITKKEDIDEKKMNNALIQIFEDKKCPEYAKKQWNSICNAVMANKSAIIQRPGHDDIDLDDIVNIVAEARISLIDLRLFLSMITKGLLK
ncbi:unnamed protein product [Blepharisma stoltei]|uniref:Uncharacterized protein n=1 Tax=Blepharisma stoltei TaxID=1481888 RepID=A0AAU9JF32_9CILI|nr:unnamed protein product [Blepharisma stoltei]